MLLLPQLRAQALEHPHLHVGAQEVAQHHHPRLLLRPQAPPLRQLLIAPVAYIVSEEGTSPIQKGFILQAPVVQITHQALVVTFVTR